MKTNNISLKEQLSFIKRIRNELSILYPDTFIPNNLYDLNGFLFNTYHKTGNKPTEILFTLLDEFIENLEYQFRYIRIQNLDQLKANLKTNPDAYLILEYRYNLGSIGSAYDPEINNYFKLKRFLNENQ